MRKNVIGKQDVNEQSINYLPIKIDSKFQGRTDS